MAAINPFDDLMTNCWKVVSRFGAVRVDDLAREGADMTRTNPSRQLAAKMRPLCRMIKAIVRPEEGGQ